MAERHAHRRAKLKAAGRGGRTEVPLPGGQRLDALTKGGGRGTEIELSGTAAGLRKAAGRLKKAGTRQKVLQVPQKDMRAAAHALRRAGISGTVKNMGGTRRRHIRKR